MRVHYVHIVFPHDPGKRRHIPRIASIRVHVEGGEPLFSIPPQELPAVAENIRVERIPVQVPAYLQGDLSAPLNRLVEST